MLLWMMDDCTGWSTDAIEPLERCDDMQLTCMLSFGLCSVKVVSSGFQEASRSILGFCGNGDDLNGESDQSDGHDKELH